MSHGEAETEAAGERLGTSVQAGDVLLLNGELGAGKTTFVRGLARGAGFVGDVLSPTFQLLRLYPGRVPLAHVDLYRLAHPSDIADLGLEEMLEVGAAAIEWGDRLSWPGVARLKFEVLGRSLRRLTLTGAPEHWSW
ncbi:tRNA (adenosine(37)-N6)-threonylcarbamoyltransferase complex ATPase subunit type 1 TsaE [Candidatus Dormiibacter inghamiae]|uniref:tRNA (adenosine(37)-N6)-threonylcarbamoyltransferase complex ATPase subunit type 1 TsaE n=1 Tax=Candidatus Dormiibacter inghamiae TaxID=3127013 RepID=UPI0030C6645E